MHTEFHIWKPSRPKRDYWSAPLKSTSISQSHRFYLANLQTILSISPPSSCFHILRGVQMKTTVGFARFIRFEAVSIGQWKHHMLTFSLRSLISQSHRLVYCCELSAECWIMCLWSCLLLQSAVAMMSRMSEVCLWGRIQGQRELDSFLTASSFFTIATAQHQHIKQLLQAWHCNSHALSMAFIICLWDSERVPAVSFAPVDHRLLFACLCSSLLCLHTVCFAILNPSLVFTAKHCHSFFIEHNSKRLLPMLF